MTSAERKVSVIVPVFEDGARALDAALALHAQRVSGATLEVVIVDDGSRERTVRELDALPDDTSIRVVRLAQNAGRSAARNRGAEEAQGDVLVFMDCDCLPADAHFVQRHLDAIDAGHVATCGDVKGFDDAFWSRYQAQASVRRRHAFAAGRHYAGTSQNLAVRRATFFAAGEFDSAYRQYGFEDRDLLIRMGRLGTIGWVEDACVIHRDILSLPSVFRKLREAGRFGAARFHLAYPDAYRALGYGRIDASGRFLRRSVAILAGRLAEMAAPWLDRLATSGVLPFPVAAMIVKLGSAASFARGTAEATGETLRRPLV
ncbi:glycosyltransferase [Luteibacter sp. PPL552]